MTIDPAARFAGKINVPTASYPQGSARDVAAPNDGTGTPFEQNWLNDWFGFEQALHLLAGTTPNNNSDTALIDGNQLIQGMHKRFGGVENSLAELKARDYQIGANVLLTGDVGFDDTARHYVIVAGGTGSADDFDFVDLANGDQAQLAKIFTYNVNTGDGLTGGGSTNQDRTLSVDLSGDGSLAFNIGQLQVGIITDTQHGTRAGGGLHPDATGSTAGFMSASDKNKIDSSGILFEELLTGNPANSVGTLTPTNGNQYLMIMTPTTQTAGHSVIVFNYSFGSWERAVLLDSFTVSFTVNGSNQIVVTGLGGGQVVQISVQVFKNAP